MLSRIGNYLFWLGRYIERAEHISRFARVQFIASVDMPMTHRKEFALRSTMGMAGFSPEVTEEMTRGQACEEDVFYRLFLSPSEPISVLSTITLIRENARGARDALSTELWEAINKFYHYFRQYPAAQLRAEGPFYLSRSMDDYIAIIKGYIDNSLIHNGGWGMITMGMHLERSIQITRILETKCRDIRQLREDHLPGVAITSQVGALLRSAEAFDMSRRYYRSLPTLNDALDFLLLNEHFPKSARFNLHHANLRLQGLSLGSVTQRSSPEFGLSRLASDFSYLSVDDIAPDPEQFCKQSLGRMYDICQRIEQDYLSI